LTLFGRKQDRQVTSEDEADLTKLFFDSFSKKVSGVEDGLKKLAREVETLHLSLNKSQISDLVLLERLQKAEGILKESLTWIKTVAESVPLGVSGPLGRTETAVVPKEPSLQASHESRGPMPFQGIAISDGERSSLPTITTPTELQVLALLAEHGPKSAPEIGKMVGRSREHSARLMKKLYEEGYVNRDQMRIPFRYSAVERVKASFKKPEKKDEVREEAAVAQS
jgi:DNA-binding CsgD family transcriptional regulator